MTVHDVKGAAHSDEHATNHPLLFFIGPTQPSSLLELIVLVLWLKTLLFCQPVLPRKNNHIG